MVSFWWVSVAQAVEFALVGEVAGSWVGYLGNRVGKSDLVMYGEGFIVEDVLVIRVVGYF